MIYSNLKPAWHLDRIKDLREGNCWPAQVQLIISDLCNQDCDFCAYRSSSGFNSGNFGGNPNRKIPTDKIIEILEACRGKVNAIQFTGGGEPTVHPDHLAIFEYAQRYFKTGLVTNGIKIKPHDVYENFDWIRVSLDAGTPETYAKIRKSSLWARAVTNLSYLSESCRGVVGTGFVVTPDNYLEIVDAAKIKSDYIRYSAVFSKDGIRPYEPIYHEIKELIQEARQFNEVHDLFGDRIQDLKQGRPDYDFCGYQYLNLYVGGNQKVYRCCTTAYTPLGEIGDLTKNSLKEIIENRSEFSASQCHTCQFNEKNKVINYLVDTPIHVDFV